MAGRNDRTREPDQSVISTVDFLAKAGIPRHILGTRVRARGLRGRAAFLPLQIVRRAEATTVALLSLGAALFSRAPMLAAQGVTGAAIAGKVVSIDSAPVEQALVHVTNALHAHFAPGPSGMRRSPSGPEAASISRGPKRTAPSAAND